MGKGGNSICEHDRFKYQCKDCGNGAHLKKCEAHGKKKGFCAICPDWGSLLCMAHGGKRRDRCKECKKAGIGGSALCEHLKQKHQCPQCKQAKAADPNAPQTSVKSAPIPGVNGAPAILGVTTNPVAAAAAAAAEAAALPAQPELTQGAGGEAAAQLAMTKVASAGASS